MSSLTPATRLLPLTVAALLQALPAAAQHDPVPKKRLQSPVRVSGYVGGEAHDGYVIRARRGHTLSARLSGWRGRRSFAALTVTRSSSFFNAGPAPFGRESEHARNWRGRIPVTGDYYLYVTSHPDSHYTLSVRLR